MSARRNSKKQIGLRSKPEGKTAWDRLPFVGKDHGKYQSSWDVPLTGGYFGGIEVGEIVARMFLKYLRDTRDDPLKMGSMRFGMVLEALHSRTPTTKDEESALRGQQVGFRSEIAYWLDAAAERLGSSFDAIPARSFVQQANEALLRTDAQLMAAIKADQKTKVT